MNTHPRRYRPQRSKATRDTIRALQADYHTALNTLLDLDVRLSDSQTGYNAELACALMRARREVRECRQRLVEALGVV